MNSVPNKIDIQTFLNSMNNPDEDFAVIELQKINKMFEDYKEVNIQDSYREFIIDMIVERTFSKKSELVETTLRTIVLLARYFPVNCLDHLFTQIIETFHQPDNRAIRPHLLTVLKEILANHVNYEPERNAEIFSCLLPKVLIEVQSQSGENLSFIFELFSSLVGNLGSLATGEQLKEILDRILMFIDPKASKDRHDQIQYVNGLVKEWSRHASQDLVEVLVKQLFSDDLGNSEPRSIMISTLGLTSPTKLVNYIEQIFNMLYDDLNMSENEDDQDIEDTLVDDDKDDNENIRKIQTSLETLASLLKALPDQMIAYTDKLIAAFFKYIDFEVEESADDIGDASEDDDIDIEIDDDMEDSGDPFDSDEENEMGSSEETWKCRKAAASLGTSLVLKCQEDLCNQIKNGSYQNIQLSLNDTDSGSKKDILELVSLIIITFKNQLPDEIINGWIDTISEQAKPSDTSIVHLLSTLTTIISNVEVSIEAVSKIINNLKGCITDVIGSNVIGLCRALIKSLPDVANQIPLLADIISEVMVVGNEKFAFSAMDVAKNLYKKSNLSSNIINLNKIVLEFYNKKGENIIHTIPVLSVFISVYGMVETSKESLEAIINSIKEPPAAKVTITAVIRITLNQKEIACQFVNRILEDIINYSYSLDTMIVFYSLWALHAFVNNEMIDPQIIADSALKIITNSIKADTKTKTIAFALFELIARKINIFEETVNIVFQNVTNNQFQEDALKNAASFLATVTKYSPEKMLTEIQSQFDKCNENKEFDSPAAYCIGVITAVNSELFEPVLKYITSFIEKEHSTFGLSCLGELFSSVQMKPNNPIFENVTKLLSPDQPRAVFHAAAHAISGITAGNPNELIPIILKEAEDNETNFVIWLTAIELFTEKLIHIKKEDICDDILRKLFDYLINEREVKKEAEQNIANSLANISLFNYSLLEILIQKTAENIQISHVTALAIDIFFKKADREGITEYLPRIINFAIPENFKISAASALNCLKSALKYNDLVPKVLEKLESIVNCLKFDESHIEIISTGLDKGNDIRNDVGKEMRCSATELLAELRREEVDPNVLIDAAITAIKDPNYDVVACGMNLITKLGMEEGTKDATVLRIKDIVEAFMVAHKEKEEIIPQDIEIPMYKAVATMAYATRQVPSPELAAVRERYRDSQQMAKIEEDIESEISALSAVKASKDAYNDISEDQVIFSKISPESFEIYMNSN